MKYTNPIIAGMHPDPSICKVGDTYYLINSSFEYFPGIPVFSSRDLVNWSQIGNCLTGKAQQILSTSPCSGGIFAPVIRWYMNKFYIITSCFNQEGIHNFIITADKPDSEWSDPLYFDADGIDPSLYWEDDRTYVQYAGRGKILQIEIDLNSGAIIKGPELLTTGCGGRDVEGPHLWKKDDWYYLMVAEGGTREGHMENLLRSKNLWGPFEPSPYNPVISNKDMAGEPIQCVGHADWIVGPDGNDYLVALGTRPWKHKTILGRETMLSPAYWTKDGWLRSTFGYMPSEWEGDLGTQYPLNKQFILDMSKQQMPFWIISPRSDHKESYQFMNGVLKITGNHYRLEDGKCSFWAVRQSSMCFKMEMTFRFVQNAVNDEAGITMLATEDYHFSVFCTTRDNNRKIVIRKKLADVVEESVSDCKISEDHLIHLTIYGRDNQYEFRCNDQVIGTCLQKHLSTECADTPNTGMVGGFFVTGNGVAYIDEFSYVNE